MVWVDVVALNLPDALPCFPEAQTANCISSERGVSVSLRHTKQCTQDFANSSSCGRGGKVRSSGSSSEDLQCSQAAWQTQWHGTLGLRTQRIRLYSLVCGLLSFIAWPACSQVPSHMHGPPTHAAGLHMRRHHNRR